MTDSEKIEFLAGRVHALIGFATAVITSHPDPTLLAHHIERIGDLNLAKAEASAVHEEYILGVVDMRDRLRAAVATTLAQRTSSK